MAAMSVTRVPLLAPLVTTGGLAARIGQGTDCRAGACDRRRPGRSQARSPATMLVIGPAKLAQPDGSCTGPSAVSGTAFVNEHHDGLDAPIQRARSAYLLAVLTSSRNSTVCDAGRVDDAGRALERHADEATDTPSTSLMSIRGRSVCECACPRCWRRGTGTGADVAVAVLAAVDRVAAAFLQAFELGYAFVELVVADRA